jgi:hypothetical protein
MRLSIRDLFWATLVVAMGLAWWMNLYPDHKLREDYSRLERECQRYRAEARSLQEQLDRFTTRRRPPTRR